MRSEAHSGTGSFSMEKIRLRKGIVSEKSDNAVALVDGQGTPPVLPIPDRAFGHAEDLGQLRLFQSAPQAGGSDMVADSFQLFGERLSEAAFWRTELNCKMGM